MTNKVIQIKKRSDFLRVAKQGQKVIKSGLVLQAFFREVSLEEGFLPVVRIGYTASKKVGNAVSRNRAKRRLRALCAELLPLESKAGYDYVVIARYNTVDRPFKKLYNDLKDALQQIKNEKNETGTQNASE